MKAILLILLLLYSHSFAASPSLPTTDELAKLTSIYWFHGHIDGPTTTTITMEAAIRGAGFSRMVTVEKVHLWFPDGFSNRKSAEDVTIARIRENLHLIMNAFESPDPATTRLHQLAMSTGCKYAVQSPKLAADIMRNTGAAGCYIEYSMWPAELDSSATFY